MRLLSRHWPIAVCITLFLALTGLLVRQCLHRTGIFIYPLDDTYIHLAIARNLVRHGVWGMTPNHFGAASSSLLWPVLIAGAFKLTGIHTLTAMVLATVCAALVLVVAYAIGRREKMPDGVTLAMMGAILFCTPLMTLAISGMEHACQALIDLAFLYTATRTAAAAGRVSVRQAAIVAALAALTTAVRYEGLFLVAMVILAMLLRRRSWLALIVGVAAAAPIAAFGIFSLHRGGLFIANSVILKGRIPRLVPSTLASDLLRIMLGNFYDVPALLWLTLAAISLLLARRAAKRSRVDAVDLMLAVAAGTTLLHCTFAAVGILFRYEAYLIPLLIVPVTLALGQVRLRPYDWKPATFLSFVEAALLGAAIVRAPWLFPAPTFVGDACQILFGVIFLCALFDVAGRYEHATIRLRHIVFVILFAAVGLALGSQGLFVAAAVGAVDLIRRRWPRASFAAMAAFAPLAIAGVLLVTDTDKGFSGVSFFRLHWRENGLAAGMILFLAIAFLLKPPLDLGSLRTNLLRSSVGIAGLVVLLTLLAPSESFFRYEPFFHAESYFVLILAAAAVLALTDFGQVARAVGLISTILVVLFSLAVRGADVWRLTPRSCGNVHDQQYQTTQFVGEFYPHAAVAVNDIGMVTYFNDIGLFDVLGLDDADIARRRLHHTMTRPLLADLARSRGVRIAIVSKGWLGEYGGAPAQWKEVGEWKIADNFVCAFDTVTFYATEPAEAGPLAQRLRQFEAHLPPGVQHTSP